MCPRREKRCSRLLRASGSADADARGQGGSGGKGKRRGDGPQRFALTP